jgi:hypothetical protein
VNGGDFFITEETLVLKDDEINMLTARKRARQQDDEEKLSVEILLNLTIN